MSVDISKIKPGDEVLVRGVCLQHPTEPGAKGEAIDWVPHFRAGSVRINHEAIVSHTPKALAVGDRVKVADYATVRASILAISGKWAWLKDDGESHWREPLSRLERAND
jgi:hypothetical protein